ncbi:reverse transcriptase domain-containing protein [Tanacetum coccineum]
MSSAPKSKEELIRYLCAAREAVSAVLLTKRDSRQVPVYFVSRALQTLEINYNSMEKLVLTLVHAMRRLRRYFQAHPVVVITNQLIKQILSRLENMGKIIKWKFELEAFDLTYRPRTSICGQILADFITERHDEEGPSMEVQAEEAIPEPWTLFTDGSSCLKGSGVGLILTSPEGKEFTYALRFKFDASNNEAEYEALVAGLRIAEQMGVKNLIAKVDSRLVANQINGLYEAKEQSMTQYLEKAKTLIDRFEIFSIKQVSRSENKKADALRKIASTSFDHLTKQALVETVKRKAIEEREILAVVEEEGYYWMTPLVEYLTEGTLPAKTKKARAIKIKARRMHSGLRSMVAKAIRFGYYWPTMHKDARNIIRKCDDCQTHQPVPRNPQQNLTPITSPWPFYKWGIDISGLFPEAQGKVKFLIVAIDYFTKWIEAKPVATITRSQVKKFVWDNIVCRFGLSGEIISDNGKQFRDNPFKDWCEKLNIKKRLGEASHAKESGKLGPKWEGPYEVVEALRKGAYKLRNGSGDVLPRTWNVQDLKKCYL